MFDDPQKELRRMERLLAEEGPEEETDDGWLDDELAEAHRLLGDELPEDDEEDMDQTRIYRNFANGYGQPQVRNYANGYGAHPQPRNRDRVDEDIEEYSDRVYEEPKEKSNRWLVILACLETLGIVAVALYWVLVLL